MKSKRLYILIRYSIVSNFSKSWWIISKTGDVDIEEIKNRVFNEERMLVHETLFSDVTVPSLADLSAHDVDVRVFIFTSKNLPEKYRLKLNEFSSTYRNFSVFDVDEDENYVSVMQRKVASDLEESEQDEIIYATVRFDDDDALSKSYARQISAYMKPEYCGFCVSLGRGYIGYYENSKYTGFSLHEEPMNAQGIASINMYKKSEPSKVKIIYEFGSHATVHHKVPTIVDSRYVSYIYTLHAQSDVARRVKNRIDSKGKTIIKADEIKGYFSPKCYF